MSGSLPDMADWDAVFDETYLRAYVPALNEERARDEALDEAGFVEADCFADWKGETPPTPERRLIVRAR